MQQTFQLIIGFLFLATVQAGQLCGLCGSMNQMPTRWDHVVSTSPLKTCRHIFFDMASMSRNDAQCHTMQQRYQDACCNAQPQNEAVSAPPPAQSTGNEPFCRICRNDDFPGYPNVMISARYVGTFSCASLYERGRNGLIPGFMCGPLQARAYEICGCGQEVAESQSNLEQTPRPNLRPTPRPNPPRTRPPTRPPTQAPRAPTPPPYGSCYDSRGWTDPKGYNCQNYADTEVSGVRICQYHQDHQGAGGLTPVQACCACKYVTGQAVTGQASNSIAASASCSDSNGWTDPNGYTCQNYADTEASGTRVCEAHRDIPGANGLTCVQACCACK